MLLSGLQIYLEDHILNNGYALILDGKIQEVGSGLPDFAKDIKDHRRFSSKHKLIPGFIDVHIHGANGSDVMDATFDAIQNMASALPKEGTTSFLATTITQAPEAIEKALMNVKEYMEHQEVTGAEVLGIHLEGPFINKANAGAQPIQFIRDPDIELFKQWNDVSGGNIKYVTVAPEIADTLPFINYLKKNGIIASIGHSSATFKDVSAAVSAGAQHVTHLFNGMSGFHHREPGLVGSSFLLKSLYTEVIADGIHIVPESLEIAYKIIGPKRMILITDAMRAKCLRNGRYDLGGQEVTVEDGKATLASGQLAGSVLKMDQAMRNMMTFTEADLTAVIEMAAVNPAKQLGVFDRKGSINVGKDADLLILDENNRLSSTFCRGHEITEKE